MDEGRLWVGVLELLEASLHYLAARIDLKSEWRSRAGAPPRSVVARSGTVLSDQNLDKPPRDQVPEWVVANLTGANVLDCELYRRAVGRVEGEKAGGKGRRRAGGERERSGEGEKGVG